LITKLSFPDEKSGAKESMVMKHDTQMPVQGGPESVQDPHRSLHSETGARPGEHPGRSGHPLVKVAGLAWLEFEKPDLDRAERFYADFGFSVADRTPETLLLRGRQASAACLVVRRGPRARFVGPAFAAAARDDLDRLARGAGGTVTTHRGGHGVLLRDPSGYPVRVVHSVPELPALPERAPLPLNFGVFGHSGDSGHSGAGPLRANATQRPARRAAEIQRLGHVVLGTTRFGAALDWYLDTLGLIVSDFLYLDGQRDRGPAMAFIRCDLGSVPSDHHTLAMALMPQTGYLHSAYQVADIDEVAASGEYLRERGYRHAWGLGRHIQGSQIFDYWRDPDRLMFEHYTDGDMFDATMEPGWAPMSVSGLAQWGPKATAEFTGTKDPRVVVAAIKALRDKGNEIDLHALRGLIKAMGS
jgi:catechol 2,3-dioxygenase-like lactoylglutathione lyase family enzyme